MKIKRMENQLAGQWWTEKDEMIEDLLDLEYATEEINDEYVIVIDLQDEDEHEYILYLGHANRTMWIEKIQAA